MSLASRIAASSRRPTATVRVAGARWADWLSISRDQSYGGNISGGTAVGRALPSGVSIGTPISWSWGYDGEETAGFSGVVAEIDTSSYPNRISLRVADPLWKASRRQQDIATDPLNSIAASAAIAQILAGAGLTRIAIPPLAASGSAWAGDEWIMGTLTPVAFANSTALAAAQRIAETLGYWLYADASGVVRAVLLERRPSDSPFRTLRWGEDFVIAGTPSRRQPDTRKNRIVIRGASTGVQGAQIRDAWQDDPGDRSDEKTFELIEYVNESEAGAASITGVARRILRLLNRDPNIIEIPRLKADPRLSVGMTIAVVCAQLGYTAPKPFFVYSLSTRLDRLKGDFAQSLTLDGGVGSGGYTLMPPPEASFRWRLVRETLDGAGVVEVFLDGSGSVALGGGEIVSYAWSTATAVASGFASTASGPQAMLVFPAATATAEITLTVMDTSSKTGAITQTVPLAGDETTTVTTRTISVALGSAWGVTPDGGATWNVEATGDSTLVPESSSPDGLASTAGSGSPGIRGSADALASASTTLVASLGGQITALWDTQTLGRRWAAVGAALYLTTDNWATHTLWGTLPDTIVGILEDPAAVNSVFVLAGADMLHSTLDTPGTAWVTLYAGPSGATARQLVRGQSGATTWVAYTGTFIGSPLQRVEGPIVTTFPVVSPDVTEIRALALSPDELTVYAWDAQGRGWAAPCATGIATALSATLGSGETAQHALHDPDDSIVYLATFGATAGTTYKYFPLADALMAFYVPADGQQAHRVGFGATPPLAPYEILLITEGSDPGGVWHYAGSWALKNSGLPTGVWWRRVATNPSNPSDWLLWGDNNSAFDVSGGLVTSGGNAIVYRTTNSGVTWAPIDLPDAGVGGAPPFRTDPILGYTSTGQPYVLWNRGVGAAAIVLWHGDALTPTVLLSTGGRGVYGAVAGQGGEIALTFRTDTSNTRYGYIANGATAITDVGDAGELETAHLIATPDALGRAIVVAGDYLDAAVTDAISVPDYRSGSAAGSTTAGGRRVAGAWGSVYLGLRSDGVYRLTNLSGTPTGAVVTASGDAVGGIASDPQTRTVVACLTGIGASNLLLTTDGETWAIVGGPGDNVAYRDLAVLTRPGL